MGSAERDAVSARGKRKAPNTTQRPRRPHRRVRREQMWSAARFVRNEPEALCGSPVAAAMQPTHKHSNQHASEGTATCEGRARGVRSSGSHLNTRSPLPLASAVASASLLCFHCLSLPPNPAARAAGRPVPASAVRFVHPCRPRRACTALAHLSRQSFPLPSADDSTGTGTNKQQGRASVAAGGHKWDRKARS
jgi:hypothetical protein